MMPGMGCDSAYFDWFKKHATALKMKHDFAENQVSEQAATEADAAARAACLRAKFLCRTKRDALLPTLGGPNLTPGDREARQCKCDELASWLVQLEAACPGELEYAPPPKSTATRTLL
jgi:hypothetical protein